MQLDDFKVLSFECYGTLIDKDAGIYTALRHLLNTGRITLSRDEVLATFAQVEHAQQLETPELSYANILAGAHRRLAKTWGVVASDDDHLLFGKSVASWPVFVDAPAALQYLQRYFTLVVLTYVDRDSFVASKRQLAVRFDAIFTREDSGARKPDMGSFEYMVTQLGVPKRQILHVAESMYNDLTPASSCGLATTWINRHPATDLQIAAGVAHAPCTFQFPSMVDMVRAHQEQLVA